MKLLNIKFLPVLVCFVSGIQAAYFYDYPFLIWLFLITVSFITLILLKKRAARHLLQKPGFALVSYMTFFLLGALIMKFNSYPNLKSYYPDESLYGVPHYWVISVKYPLKPSENYLKYEAELLQMNSKKVKSKILLNVKKGNHPGLSFGNAFAVKASLSPIKKNRNPGQFDYADYLKKKQIFNQIHVSHENIKPLDPAYSIAGFALQLRDKLRGVLNHTSFEKDELAILNALLLGYRYDITDEINEAFSKAGVIHILAISGLHIGILLLLLNFIFKPLENLKRGSVYKSILLILLLWGFALLTGLSPSVVRAVTMFSFLAYALNRKKLTNTLHVMLVSIFFILLFNPMFIFDIGFQLSYAAVFSVLWIQPLIVKKFNLKNKIIRYLWTILSVTLAAQIGLLPLSLFYFHQFPGLFFISNLAILPFLGFILGFGFLILLLALLNFTPDWLIDFYSIILSALTDFVLWVARQESFIFQDLFFDGRMLITSYLFLVTLIFLIKKYSKSNLIATGLAFSIMVGTVFWSYHTSGTKNNLVIFHQNRQTLIAWHKANALTVYTNPKANAEGLFPIKNYRIQHPISYIETRNITRYHNFDKEKVVIIDSLYDSIPLHSTLVLTNSPRINLERLILRYKPTMIIADGSNYKSYKQRWKRTCQEYKLPYHDTYEKGAVTINY